MSTTRAYKRPSRRLGAGASLPTVRARCCRRRPRSSARPSLSSSPFPLAFGLVCGRAGALSNARACTSRAFPPSRADAVAALGSDQELMSAPATARRPASGPPTTTTTTTTSLRTAIPAALVVSLHAHPIPPFRPADAPKLQPSPLRMQQSSYRCHRIAHTSTSPCRLPIPRFLVYSTPPHVLAFLRLTSTSAAFLRWTPWLFRSDQAAMFALLR